MAWRHRSMAMGLVAASVAGCARGDDGGPYAVGRTPGGGASSPPSSSVSAPPSVGDDTRISAAGPVETFAPPPPGADVPTLPTTPESPYLGPLTFAWPTGCAVSIAESVERPELTELTYSLRLESAGDGVSVVFTDVVVNKAGGREVPADEQAGVAALFSFPELRVGADGIVAEVLGAKAIAEELIAAEPAAGQNADELAAQLEDTVVGKYWEAWVGFWSRLESIGAEDFSRVIPGTISSGDIDTAYVIRSARRSADGYARLFNSRRVDGESFLRLIDELTATSTDEEIDAAMARVSGSRTSTFEVVIDPLTLRPSAASFDLDIEVTRDGVADQYRERFDWTFDWSACPT